MVIENYFDLAFPYSDLVIEYSENIILGLSGAGIFALLKNQINSA